MGQLFQLTERGLFCEQGGFYIDPWLPVDRAVVTHAHSDHARFGMGRYLCASPCKRVLALRVGDEAPIDTLEYGEEVDINGVKLSFHPAGHILGSAQVRLEWDGEVAVISGDYKTQPDPTCAHFELVRCHTFVTESTFGLPIYRWQPDNVVFDQMNAWWRQNQELGRASILFGYALGKSQRALAGLDAGIGPIFLHGALLGLTEAYREEGIELPATHEVFDVERGYDWSKAMILAPPSANGTPWLRRFGDQSTAFMSGWMAIRGTRRRGAHDRGFVLSDHVDWPSLLNVVKETGAETVFVTHGYEDVVVRYLTEQGLDARVLNTQWPDEQAEEL